MNEEWESTLRKAIEILKETRASAECNVSNMYWTNVRMGNNRGRFSPRELKKGEELEQELGGLVESYDQMITILQEALHILAQAQNLENPGVREEREQLQQKMISCLQNGRHALERQRVVEKEMLDLEASLKHRKRRGVRLWISNSRVKI